MSLLLYSLQGKKNIVEDRKLPRLQEAGDDLQMLTLFRTIPALAERWPVHVLHRVTHAIRKHKPGKHCVIAYTLEFDEGESAPVELIGKLYRKNRGEHAYFNMRQVWMAWGELAGNSTAPGMAQPLAYLPQLGMVLQSHVPGRNLGSLINEEEFCHALEHAAENLALLHRLTGIRATTKTLFDHVKKYVRPDDVDILKSQPELAECAKKIIMHLKYQSREQTEATGPVHGDFNPAQIFVHGDRSFFIDFDGCCISHPALDVSNFMTAVRERHRAKGDRYAELFFEAYRSANPAAPLENLRIYTALSYLRRAMICLRQQVTQDWPEQVQKLLDKSLAQLQVSSQDNGRVRDLAAVES